MGKKITIYDLSKETGLSTATISRVLNHPELVPVPTQHLVLQAIQKLGYKKRSYCSKNRNFPFLPDLFAKSEATYLLLLPSAQNSFYGDIIDGAVSAAENYNCHLYVDYRNITSNNFEHFLSEIERNYFAGYIFMINLPSSHLSILSSKCHYIQCSEYNETFYDASYISINDTDMEFAATEYLISLGKHDLAYFTSSLQFHYALRRMNGFKAAMEKHNIPISDHRIIQLPQVNFNVAYDAAMELLSRPQRPDAILCVSDVFAAACIKAATTLQISIPSELMIFGFDNTSISLTTTPTISTISQPRFQLGYSAFEILYREVQDSSLPKQQILLPCELIIRESTGN